MIRSGSNPDRTFPFPKPETFELQTLQPLRLKSNHPTYEPKLNTLRAFWSFSRAPICITKTPRIELREESLPDGEILLFGAGGGGLYLLLPSSWE